MKGLFKYVSESINWISFESALLQSTAFLNDKIVELEFNSKLLFKQETQMTPLNTNRKVLIVLGMHSADASVTQQQQIRNICIASAIFIAHLWGLVSSAIYFIKFVSVDLESALFGILEVSGHVNMIYMMIIAFILRHRIAAIFTSLATIYTARMNDLPLDKSTTF